MVSNFPGCAPRGLLACAPRGLLACALLLAMPAGFAAGDAAALPGDAPSGSAACPSGVAPGSRCTAGRDAQGAFWWFAVPPGWTAREGTLVVHAHGGPELGEPKPARAAEDLTRWSIWTRAGAAYAGSGYRQGGVAVRSAAEDTERVRQAFVAANGRPRRTILHGQSWGAGVAARTAELFGAPTSDHPAYDAVLLTSGVLAGGSRSYDFRLDLRLVYQDLCHNHPRPEEPDYPLWQGLPPGSALTRDELARRVDDCLGPRLAPTARSPEQQARLDTVLRVVRIREDALAGHLAWATWHFQDIAFARAGGRNVFDNLNVRYAGTSDDAAFNARVPRYPADPQARADFVADTDPQGRITVPVLTLHAVDDPVAFVEIESEFRDTMVRGGSGDRLVQLFSDDRQHSYLSDAAYVAALQALLGWVDRGQPPTPAGVAAACRGIAPAFDPATGCRFLPDYHPGPLSSRVAPR
jgi:alpha-beta hydrolase superfamily lysophospholipase